MFGLSIKNSSKGRAFDGSMLVGGAAHAAGHGGEKDGVDEKSMSQWKSFVRNEHVPRRRLPASLTGADNCMMRFCIPAGSNFSNENFKHQ